MCAHPGRDTKDRRSITQACAGSSCGRFPFAAVLHRPARNPESLIGTKRIVPLVRLHVGLHVLRRHQSHFMTLFAQRPPQKVSSTTVIARKTTNNRVGLGNYSLNPKSTGILIRYVVMQLGY